MKRRGNFVNKRIIHLLLKWFYPNYRPEWKIFYDIIETHLNKQCVVLDAGAGNDLKQPHSFKEKVKEIIGVDLNPSVAGNPLLHKAVVADLKQLPFKKEKFDVIFSKYVLEHLADPSTCFAEFSRVLKKGGRIFLLTTNLRHYGMKIAKNTPLSFHKLVTGRIDVFPKYYKVNKKEQMIGLARANGLSVEKIMMVETLYYIFPVKHNSHLCKISEKSLNFFFNQKIGHLENNNSD